MRCTAGRLGRRRRVCPPPVAGAKPVIAATPKSVEELDRAAREVAAVAAVLEDPAVAGDPVARGELGERLAQARAEFDRVFSVAFRTDACRWTMCLEESGEQRAVFTPG